METEKVKEIQGKLKEMFKRRIPKKGRYNVVWCNKKKGIVLFGWEVNGLKKARRIEGEMTEVTGRSGHIEIRDRTTGECI